MTLHIDKKTHPRLHRPRRSGSWAFERKLSILADGTVTIASLERSENGASFKVDMSGAEK
jgi:hypothetical protein